MEEEIICAKENNFIYLKKLHEVTTIKKENDLEIKIVFKSLHGLLKFIKI